MIGEYRTMVECSLTGETCFLVTQRILCSDHPKLNLGHFSHSSACDCDFGRVCVQNPASALPDYGEVFEQCTVFQHRMKYLKYCVSYSRCSIGGFENSEQFNALCLTYGDNVCITLIGLSCMLTETLTMLGYVPWHAALL